MNTKQRTYQFPTFINQTAADLHWLEEAIELLRVTQGKINDGMTVDPQSLLGQLDFLLHDLCGQKTTK